MKQFKRNQSVSTGMIRKNKIMGIFTPYDIHLMCFKKKMKLNKIDIILNSNYRNYQIKINLLKCFLFEDV